MKNHAQTIRISMQNSKQSNAINQSFNRRQSINRYPDNRHVLIARLLNIMKNELAARQKLQARFDWRQNARPSQLLPQGDWRTWLILAGRGFGKTRTGAETVRQLVQSKTIRHIGLIGQSLVEAASVMVEGESGLLSIFPPNERPIFKPSQQKIYFKNGAKATLFGGNTPERLRGPQFDFVWIDEFAKFRNPDILYDQVMMGLRLGENPRCLITTTPRPVAVLEELMKHPTTVVTRGSTFDNAKNLAPSFIEQMKRTYSATKLGAQELYAEMLTERDGALWNRELIRYSMPGDEKADQNWRRIVIAIDPATTHHAKSDETGIIVAGLHQDGFVYILDDLSGKLPPAEWGAKVTDAYWHYKADRVVAEVNKGGDLVERIVKSIDPHVAYRAVRATRGKHIRAEPVAALYEQKKVYHIRPFQKLEAQLCEYIPNKTAKSPDRMDALVWALTDLMLAREASLEPKIWEV